MSLERFSDILQVMKTNLRRKDVTFGTLIENFYDSGTQDELIDNRA